MHYDVVIVGGGIVGLSTAYQLQEALPDWSIAVLEKEKKVAQHQSKNNSGVIHSGIYYKPGSLRARNCHEGHAMLIEFCQRHDIPYELCGKLIVATSKEEIPTLEAIRQKGIQNGLTNLDIIGPEAAKEIEPHVRCVQAIKVPQAGIVSYELVAQTYARLFEEKGGTILCNVKVDDIATTNEGVRINTAESTISSKWFVSCGGLYADRLAKMTTEPVDYQILPFRGEYYELKKEKEYLARHLIYPVPDGNFPFLGVHFTRMINGGIEAGPNAVLAFKREGYHHSQVDRNELFEILRYTGFQKLAAKYWRTGLQEMHRSYSKKAFVRALQKLIPSITSDDVVIGRSGVRAMACDPNGQLIDDFIILESQKGLNVVSAPSPAATASLAIGKEIVARFKRKTEQ